MSEPIPASEEKPPAKSDAGLQRNIAAGLACLFSLVGGIVFLVLERRDKFVRFWAMQAVLWGGLAIFAALAVSVTVPVLGWLPIIGGLLQLLLKLLYWGFKLAWVVVFLVCVIKAFSNLEWEIPGIGKLARRQLARLDETQQPPV